VAGGASGCEAVAGDFSGRGVNLMMVVPLHFVLQDRSDILEGGQFVQGTRANQAIL